MKEVIELLGTMLCFIIGLFPLTVLVYAMLYPLMSMSCHATWEESKLPVDYGLFSGCRVELPSGRWVPVDAYKEIRGALQ